jgi:hypothetical protein
MNDWFLQLNGPEQLALWIVASFLLYTLSSQLAWQYHVPGRADALGRWIDRFRDSAWVPWCLEASRFIYYLGIPFLAAVNGLLGTDVLGLFNAPGPAANGWLGFPWQDWVRGLGWAVLVTLALVAVWVTGQFFARRNALTPLERGPGGPKRSIWQRWLYALYDQVHWAFYRSGPMLWLDDFYWGVWAGLGLVLLEATLNPALGWSLKDPQTAGPVLARLAMAGVSAFLFLMTRNLWLVLAAHLMLATYSRFNTTASADAQSPMAP